MSGTVPRLPWRSAVSVLAAAVSLFAAAPALAAHRQRPTAAPLWQAYPLAGKQAAEPAATTPAAPASSQPAASDPLLQTNASQAPVTPLPEQQRKVDPVVVVLFYIAIATLIVTLALLVRRQVRRRSPRAARG